MLKAISLLFAIAMTISCSESELTSSDLAGLSRSSQIEKIVRHYSSGIRIQNGTGDIRATPAGSLFDVTIRYEIPEGSSKNSVGYEALNFFKAMKSRAGDLGDVRKFTLVPQGSVEDKFGAASLADAANIEADMALLKKLSPQFFVDGGIEFLQKLKVAGGSYRFIPPFDGLR